MENQLSVWGRNAPKAQRNQNALGAIPCDFGMIFWGSARGRVGTAHFAATLTDRGAHGERL